MIRETFADKYNEEVRLIIRELFNICIYNRLLLNIL